MGKRLTTQQMKFVEMYLASGHAQKSALAAGYSEKSAKNGYRILKLPAVEAVVRRRQEEIALETVDVDKVLRELGNIAFADAADYVAVEEGRICVKDTGVLPLEKRAAIAFVKEGTKGVEVKLHDKLRALEILGKAAGLFSEREKKEEQEKEFRVELKVVE